MPDKPLVSIIMPAFNAGPYIAEAIESVLEQTYPHWELLVADDGSSDNTREVVVRFNDPRIVVSHNPEHLHVLRTRNRLIKMAKGNYITLLDADDRMHPERLEKQVAAMESDAEVGLCGCQVEFMDVDGHLLGQGKKHPISYKEILEHLPVKNAFSGAVLMVRRSAFDEVGGQYRDFFHGMGNEDYDLPALIADKFKCINLPEVLNYYRISGISTSKNDMATNPFRFHSDKVVQRLIAQRRAGQMDDLEAGREANLIAYVVELHQPYLADPTRIHREIASIHMHYGHSRLALQSAAKAIALQPHRFVNYRTWFYVLRRRWFG